METSTLSPVYVTARAGSPRLQHAEEVAQIQLVLNVQHQAEALLVKPHHIQQSLGGAVMEKRRARRKTAKDWALDLADMVVFAVNQGLAEIADGLAIAARLPIQ